MARVRRALGTREVGHAGTLDPFATGLLVVLVGRATRLARFVERQAKEYRGEAVLGLTTDTDDATGTVTAETKVERWPSEAELEAVLGQLRGTQLQRPPAYSARRVGGRRGYQLARAGRAVDLPATPVTVAELDLVDWSPPVLTFRAVVSAGTYLRALARDLGQRLGLGAHLRSLRRVRIGVLEVEEAVPPDQVGPDTALLAPGRLVQHLPRVPLGAAELAAVRHGRAVAAPDAAGFAALVTGGDLVAVAEGTERGWQPRVVLQPA